MHWDLPNFLRSREWVKSCALMSRYGCTKLDGRTYLSMGVVKVDSCKPNWDWQAMQRGEPWVMQTGSRLDFYENEWRAMTVQTDAAMLRLYRRA
jgi:hypothetical protein